MTLVLTLASLEIATAQVMDASFARLNELLESAFKQTSAQRAGQQKSAPPGSRANGYEEGGEYQFNESKNEWEWWN